jgi:hypothetical protein
MISPVEKKWGVFIAKNHKEFHKNKTLLQAGDKYIHLGDNKYIPKLNLRQLIFEIYD